MDFYKDDSIQVIFDISGYSIKRAGKQHVKRTFCIVKTFGL